MSSCDPTNSYLEAPSAGGTDFCDGQALGVVHSSSSIYPSLGMSAKVLGLYFTYSPALSSYLNVYCGVQCVDG